MDGDIAKQTQKTLQKQGMKFKVDTKVMGGDASGEGVKLEVEAAKGGKKETVSWSCDLFRVVGAALLNVLMTHFFGENPRSSRMSFSWPLAVVRTRPALDWKTSASRRMKRDD